METTRIAQAVPTILTKGWQRPRRSEYLHERTIGRTKERTPGAKNVKKTTTLDGPITKAKKSVFNGRSSLASSLVNRRHPNS